MKRSKIFLGFVIVFIAMLIIVSYDISKKTTFPGSKPQLIERIKKPASKADTSVQPTKIEFDP